jgi:hypothetical protein
MKIGASLQNKTCLANWTPQGMLNNIIACTSWLF